MTGNKDSKMVTGVKFQPNKYDIDYVRSLEKLDSDEALNSIPCIANKDAEVDIVQGDLVIRSIGYKNVNIDKDVPFDKKRGVVSNKLGKVIEKDGLYCTGWIKRGPKGKNTRRIYELEYVFKLDLFQKVS